VLPTLVPLQFDVVVVVGLFGHKAECGAELLW
jgi:hypothetical protein